MIFTFRTDNSSPQQQTSREPRPKRAKIGIACNVCKARKTRCDGVKPICGPCAKRNHGSLTCVYREPDAALVAPNVPAAQENTSTDTGTGTGQTRYKNESQHGFSRSNNQSGFRRNSAVVPSGSFFGASSGTQILHQVRAATDPAMVSERARGIRTRVQPQPLKKLPRLQKRKEPSDIQFAVPPRKVADNLLNLYWDFVDSAYPWLDRFSIESAYETLWSKDGGASIMDERVLHCFLNLMFATSCVASQGEPPLSRYQSSITFFDRAQQLMSYDLTDMYNFEMIQILLLTAVYLQHDKEPQKCFRSIGTAIHIAQELGLHLPETTEAISDPRERALARQVWNGCVIMDRISCMTFGCALKVPQGNAREGLNALMTRTLENTALPSKVNFYVSFCRLHYIIGEVLETFYISNEDIVDEPHHPASKGYFEKFASLFRIESELISWAVDLHRFFQNPSDAQDPTPSKHITREANILRARYLSVRLLLFRPFLLQINQKPAQNNASSTRLYTDDQILSDVVLRCQLNCTRAAADMIAFIARNRPEQTQTQAYILPSNWYTVSYIYMAVTTLLAAKMSQQIMEHFSATHLPGLLNSARDILKDYEAHATLASRCSSVLRLIDENIDKGAVGGVVEPAAYPAMVPQHNNGDMVGQDTTNGIQEPQNFSENLDWVDKYAFDWNDWPTFFAQLDCDISPVGRW